MLYATAMGQIITYYILGTLKTNLIKENKQATCAIFSGELSMEAFAEE